MNLTWIKFNNSHIAVRKHAMIPDQIKDKCDAGCTVARIKFCAPHFFRVHSKKHGTGSTLYDGYCSPGYYKVYIVWYKATLTLPS